MLDYLVAVEQPFREDATNAELGFTRNRIRHELLPLLARDYSASIVESLVRLGTIAGDAQNVLEGLAERLLETSLVECDHTGAILDCRQLAAAERHLVREAFVGPVATSVVAAASDGLCRMEPVGRLGSRDE